MSDIIENIKEALNPKVREQATPPDYDPHTRGPYPDNQASVVVNPATEITQQVSPPKGDVPDPKKVATLTSTGAQEQQQQQEESQKLASGVGFNAPWGTYGPHGSRIANLLDPRVDSDRDGRPKHGLSDVGPVAARPARNT